MFTYSTQLEGYTHIDTYKYHISCYNNERPTGQKQLLDGRTVENKGKLILTYKYVY